METKHGPPPRPSPSGWKSRRVPKADPDKTVPDTLSALFELCKSFWKSQQGKLDQWTRDVKAKRIPEFGGNLVY